MAGDNGGPGKPGAGISNTSAQRVRATRRRSPARNCGPSGAGTWTAASPATTCPTLPRAQPWRLWPTWVGPGGALKRSSRLRRVTWGWTNSEHPQLGRVASPHSHVPAGWGVPAEPAAGLGGKRCPGSRGHRCTGWCGRCCPGSSSGPINCCCLAGGYAATQRTGSPFPRETPLHPGAELKWGEMHSVCKPPHAGCKVLGHPRKL